MAPRATSRVSFLHVSRLRPCNRSCVFVPPQRGFCDGKLFAHFPAARTSGSSKHSCGLPVKTEVYRMRKSIIAAALGASLLLAGCAGAPLTTREKGTLLGGAVGAGGGALVGSTVGAPGAGAAIGGALGAGTGYVVGNHMQNEEYRHRYYGDY